MSVTPSSAIVGVFTERANAEQALDALYNAGIPHEQIHYSSSETSSGFLDDLKNWFTGQNAGDNVASDLANLGLSDEEANYYANEHNKGNAILAVKAPGREAEAQSILQQYGSLNTHPQTVSADYTSNTATTTQTDHIVQTTQQPITTTYTDEGQHTEPSLTTYNDIEQQDASSVAIQNTSPITHDNVTEQAYTEDHNQVDNQEATPVVLDGSLPQESSTTFSSYDTNTTDSDDTSTPPTYSEQQPPTSLQDEQPTTSEPLATDSYETPDIHATTTDYTAIGSYTPSNTQSTTSHETTSDIQPMTSDYATVNTQPMTSENTSTDTQSTTGDNVIPDTQESVSDYTASDIEPTTSENAVADPQSTTSENAATDPHATSDIMIESETISHATDEDIQTSPESYTQESEDAGIPDIQTAQPVATTSDYSSENQPSDAQTSAANIPTQPLSATSTSTDEPTTTTTMSDAQPSTMTTSDTTTSDAQPSTMTTSDTTTGETDELQSLQAQVEALQQQLQDAKSRLQAAKDREEQTRAAREREQQLQTLRQQLQALQNELSAIHSEIQETESRMGGY